MRGSCPWWRSPRGRRGRGGGEIDSVNEPAVLLDRISRSFPPAVVALRDVSASIAVGERVALMGPSGSGKTTLLNILGLLDRASEGRYLLDGMDTSRQSE